jgi:hypothetical protein
MFTANGLAILACPISQCTQTYPSHGLGGFMVRASTDPGAPFYCLCMFGFGSNPYSMEVVIVYRATQGAASSMVDTGYSWPADGPPNAYVRLERSGNTFSAWAGGIGSCS